MSSNRNYREFGSRGAFPTPVNFNPAAFWNDTPLLGIKVNEEWVPLISGAIKHLLHEEVYERDDDSIRQQYIESIDEIVSSWRELCEPPCVDSVTADCFFALSSWSGVDSFPTYSPGRVSAAFVGGLPPRVQYPTGAACVANFEHINIHMTGTGISGTIKGYFKSDYSFCGPRVWDFLAQTNNGGIISVTSTDCVDFVNSSGAVLSYVDLFRLGVTPGGGIKEFTITANGFVDIYILSEDADCVSA